jgi:hypothetical protein
MKEKQIWYSVSELSTTFGKSESTIKRYADKLKGIEPSAVEVRGKKIYICSDYLYLILSDQERPTVENERPTVETISNELSEAIQRERLQYESIIEILKGELAAKNRQIEQLTNTVENLTNTTDLQNKLMTKLTYQISAPGENKRAWWQFWIKK